MGRLAALGYEDLFRRLHGQDQAASWWAPGHGARAGGGGQRLDHALASGPLAERVGAVFYESGAVRRGVSDHAAVVVDLDFQG